MVKTRRGWYLIDTKTKEDDERKKDEKEIALDIRRATLVKRCDAKTARRHLEIEQQEICEKEKLLHAQKIIDLKQKELEVTNRLAVELSLRKNKEIKRALKLSRVKSFTRSLSGCALREVRSRLVEKKVNLEASQAKLIKLLHEDETIEKMQQDEQEKKKRNLRADLQRQLTDDRRRIQEEKNNEKEQDRKMIEQEMQKIREEDEKIKKKKYNDMMLLREEMLASLAAKNAWKKKYEKALKDEDEKISRTLEEKEAQQKKQFNVELEIRKMREAAMDKAASKLLDDVCKKRK